MQRSRRDNQKQKEKRDNHWRNQPVDKAKSGQRALLFLGGSARNSQSPMDAHGKAGDSGPYAAATVIARFISRNRSVTLLRPMAIPFHEKSIANQVRRAHRRLNSRSRRRRWPRKTE